MIEGVVTAGREAVITLCVRGPDGPAVPLDATIDTGFTAYLSLPGDLVRRLGLPAVDRTRAFLADGTMAVIELFRCYVEWGGQEREVFVHCLEGTPLVGMRMLWGHLLTMQVTGDGPVTIVPLPQAPSA